MADRYGPFSDTAISPGTRAGVVVLSDTADLPEIPKGVYVGVGGAVAMIGVGDPDGAAGVVWPNVPAGSMLPFRPRRILATGTTASSLIAMY